jgi:UDP:flavonoid glycosyltransferase YjiC (YdhE family)
MSTTHSIVWHSATLSRRVLFSWELGGNYGHLAATIPVARRLVAEGCEVLFALRDLRVAAEILAPAGLPFISAPVSSVAVRPESVSYTDILLGSGLHDPLSFQGLMQGWSVLFELVRPDVVVVDHAPFALIESRVRGLPAVLIGSGFTVPPPVEPLPSIRLWEPIPLSKLQEVDAVALQAINAYLAQHGCSPLGRVCDLFRDHGVLLTTFPELDHYGSRADQVHYIGPATEQLAGSAMTWKPSKGARIFAYLRPTVPGLRELLTCLEESGGQVICVMPRAGNDLCKHFEGTEVRMVPYPLAVDSLLKDADLVVSYGGAGMIATSLLAGRPMLLVPYTVEQYLGALRVKELGAGIVVAAHQAPCDFAQPLGQLLSAPAYREAAAQFAEGYREFDRNQAIAHATSVIIAALEGAGTAGSKPVRV